MMLQSSFRRALPLVLACAYLQHANAIGIVGGSKQMQLADMAERGLFPGMWAWCTRFIFFLFRHP